MKDVSEVTACVVDRGIFFPVALRLARGMKKVYYHRPACEAYETVARSVPGDGHEGVELLPDFWSRKGEIDVFVFPDCWAWDLQAELAGQGYPVWGSRQGEHLEVLRDQWLQAAKEVGLKMPRTKAIQGLEEARAYLYEHRQEKLHVKISRFRGDMETWCASDWMVSRTRLDRLAYRWGPLQDLITFFIQDDLDTPLESGADSYCIDGAFPDEVILGYEKKGQSYLATVKARSEMPQEVWRPSELVAPVLGSLSYRNFFSTEVRIKDGESYLLDPCCRCPSPAGEEQLEMLDNFPEIVWSGARGELVQPEWSARFCGEAVIEFTGEKETWKTIRVPEEARRWVKLYACVYYDEAFHFPPEQDAEAIGCAVAIADTPGGVIEHLHELAEAMEEEPVSLHIEPMADLIKEIEQAEAAGIEFTEAEMPEPAEVIDD
jgi:hypothetical protein